MSLNRHATRTDANEKEIIAALKKMGAHVYRIKKPFDLLVALGGRMVLVEVKTEKGKLTKEQAEFIEVWPAPVYLLRNVEQAEMLVKNLRFAWAAR